MSCSLTPVEAENLNCFKRFVRTHKDLDRDTAPHFQKTINFYDGLAKQLVNLHLHSIRWLKLSAKFCNLNGYATGTLNSRVHSAHIQSVNPAS
ncbi:hypothetical protein SORBI_3008G045166 [Sorghum bicolor]|uniref:Uncharacterized protein n=2 Tax=Sorghum bicolor TaxID=4558 RepID=A0A1Z5R5D1_SORBI|nr:hypothetical protein SORBI_3008G045166 [Sorghum bicolor]